MKFVLPLALFALSCASAPKVKHPALDLATPDQWTSATPAGTVADHWWRDLGPAQLDSLIDQVLAFNYDLKAASARLEIAQAQAAQIGTNLADIGRPVGSRFDQYAAKKIDAEIEPLGEKQPD